MAGRPSWSLWRYLDDGERSGSRQMSMAGGCRTKVGASAIRVPGTTGGLMASLWVRGPQGP